MARGSAQNAKGNKANNQPASAKGAGSHLRANKGHESEFDDFEPLVEPSANRDIAGVVIAVLAIASFIAVISPATAPVTAAVAGFYHLGFGLGAYVLPIVILLFAATLFLGEDSPLNVRSVAGGAVVFITVVSILSLMVPGTSDSCDLMFTPQNLSASGGYIGAFIASALQNALGKPIAMVVLLGLAVVGFVIIGFSVGGVLRSARDRAADFAERRRADVNASPWGDDEALSVPGVARPHLSILRQKGSDAAVTTVMGNDVDPVLDDDDEDEDEEDAVASLLGGGDRVRDVASETRAKVKARQNTGVHAVFRHIGNIFIPVIPGFVAGGIIASIANFWKLADPTIVKNPWFLAFAALGAIVTGALNFIVGHNTAKEFGGTPVLGFIAGGVPYMTALAGIAAVKGADGSITTPAQPLVLPLFGQLSPGLGGVIGVMVTAWVFTLIEKQLRKVIPASLELFIIPALNLGGIPPFSGFIGKVALLEAGSQDGSVLAWLLVGGSVVTSLLTLYVVARVWTKAFWRARADAPDGELAMATPSSLLEDAGDVAFADRDDVGRMPVGMVTPTMALIALGLALTVFAGPIFGYAQRAASEIIDRGEYIAAVLGGAP